MMPVYSIDENTVIGDLPSVVQNIVNKIPAVAILRGFEVNTQIPSPQGQINILSYEGSIDYFDRFLPDRIETLLPDFSLKTGLQFSNDGELIGSRFTVGGSYELSHDALGSVSLGASVSESEITISFNPPDTFGSDAQPFSQTWFKIGNEWQQDQIEGDLADLIAENIPGLLDDPTVQASLQEGLSFLQGTSDTVALADEFVYEGARSIIDGGRQLFLPGSVGEECFLAGTEISMWDGTKKPIEEITPDDEVVSYDKDGNLVPGKVTRVFQNQAKHILDVFGLHVTPGHVTFCGDGKFEGKHVPIIDILRSDGALVRENGQKVRACTNEPLGTPKDNFVWAITGDKGPDGSVKVRDKGQIRLGTRYITEDGYDVSVADLIFGADAMVSPEGLVIQKIGGQGVPFLWPFTETLPKPEDYVLQRSALMLNEIYQAAEWEAVQPQMPAPVMGDLGPVQPANDAILQAMPPNVPLSMQRSANQPKMNRKQRKAHEAKQRKIAKRFRGQSTLH